MKKYFYSDGNNKQGPASIEELKEAKINGDTLVWYQGIEDWTPAKEIEELLEFLQLTPPSIPTEAPDVDLQISGNAEQSNYRSSRNSNGFFRVFSFKGRIGRGEYFGSFLAYLFGYFFLNQILLEGAPPVLFLLFIPLIWFFWGQGAKRCHDMGLSGWYQIIPFFVIGMLFVKGKKGQNKYGDNPKA